MVSPSRDPNVRFDMATLHHYPLSPSSRFIRLQFGEYNLDVTMRTQVPWVRDESFLALNPSGDLPVLEDDEFGVIAGARVISEWVEDVIEEAHLMPATAGERAEVRRLVDWFELKFSREVSAPLLRERVIKRFDEGKPASSEIMRAALTNAQIHLGYFDWLAGQNPWLAGQNMSLCDLAAAAHLSVLDYFGDINWDKYADIKMWYMKLKSRPSFKPLLADVLVGMPPASRYTDLDF